MVDVVKPGGGKTSILHMMTVIMRERGFKTNPFYICTPNKVLNDQMKFAG